MKAKINGVRRQLMSALTTSVGTRIAQKDIDAIRENSIQRVLIVRPNSRLGNQLMITPLLQEIEHHYPNCQIDIISRGGLMPIILQNYKNIGRITMLPGKPFKQLLKYMKVWLSVRKYNYDIAINIVESSSSGRLLTKFSKSKVKIYNEEDATLATEKADYRHMAKNAVYNLRQILSTVNLPHQEQKIPHLSLLLNEEELLVGKRILNDIFQNDKPVLCFYTFATGNKCYSKEWWKEVYHNLKKRYEAEYNLLEVLPKENVSQIDFQCTTYYSTSIREMAGALANADLFLTADCGVMHLASAAGVPTIGMFSRDSIKIYEPYNAHSLGVSSSKTDIPTLLQIIDNNLEKTAQEKMMLTNIIQAQLKANKQAKNAESDLNNLI